MVLSLLKDKEIVDLAQLWIQAGMPLDRPALIPHPLVLAKLDTYPQPLTQIITDLQTLSRQKWQQPEHPLCTWLHTASAVTAGIQQHTAIEQLHQTVVQRLAQGHVDETGVDPLEIPLIDDRLLCLDREPIRQRLRRMENKKLVLVVRGPPGSGKTRVGELVESWGAQKDFFRISVINISALGPRDFVERLQIQMGVSDAEVGPLSNPIKATEVTVFVSKWVKALGKQCWFLFDDLEEVPAPTWELITGLVTELSRGSISDYCRFLLIGPPDPAPGIPTSLLDAQQLTTTAIKDEHIDDFITWLFEERIKQPALAEQRQQTRSEILPPEPRDHPDWLRNLSERAQQKALDLIDALEGS